MGYSIFCFINVSERKKLRSKYIILVHVIVFFLEVKLVFYGQLDEQVIFGEVRNFDSNYYVQMKMTD